MDVLERSKISYWETRTVNIGNYEKVEMGLSISHSVIEASDGKGDKFMKISDGASATIDKADVEDINKVANHLINVTQRKLNAVEKIIRKQTADWEGIDFDTEKKLLVRGIIEKDEYTGKHKKKFELTDEDLED